MAQNITLLGANYSAVPAVMLPKTGGGQARFDDTSDANAAAADITQGKTAYVNGVKITGTNSGGGSSGVNVAVATPQSGANDYIMFGNLLGTPTSFYLIYRDEINTGANAIISALTFDGTNYVGQAVTNTANANASYLPTGFNHSYNNGGILISSEDAIFDTYNNYVLVYTYGGASGDIRTANVQVGSGATSINFPVSGNPVFWSCVFKADFGTSQGYQRVIAVANDGTNTYGLCLDSSAHASNTYWTANYSGGNFTISSQSTNAGGYFHQPGYYQLTYIIDETAPTYQTKSVTFTPTTVQQTESITPDNGYDALNAVNVTVNAIPSQYVIPSGNLAITQNGNNINVSQYETVSVNVSGGGGTLTVKTATTTKTSTSQTISFSSLSGQPKYWFLRTTTNISSSGSTTYYYITDCFYDGTNIKGNTFRIGSTRRVQNITSGITQSYSGNTLTITAGSVSTATPGQFYGTNNFGYELVYIY